MPEVRYSKKIVCEVLGVSPNYITHCRRVFNYSGCGGYTLSQIRQIKERKECTEQYGSPQQLRELLSAN